MPTSYPTLLEDAIIKTEKKRKREEEEVVQMARKKCLRERKKAEQVAYAGLRGALPLSPKRRI